jgi:hypothetical protein
MEVSDSVVTTGDAARGTEARPSTASRELTLVWEMVDEESTALSRAKSVASFPESTEKRTDLLVAIDRRLKGGGGEGTEGVSAPDWEGERDAEEPDAAAWEEESVVEWKEPLFPLPLACPSGDNEKMLFLDLQLRQLRWALLLISLSLLLQRALSMTSLILLLAKPPVLALQLLLLDLTMCLILLILLLLLLLEWELSPVKFLLSLSYVSLLPSLS